MLVTYLVAAYFLVAATMLFLTWPYAESGEVERWRVVRDSLAWPFWALLMIVEAAEEGRRSWINRRVD